MIERERERKMFWTWIEAGLVFEVEGWDCYPGHPDVWFCPKLGASLIVGHQLFPTKREAVLKAIEKTTERVRLATAILEDLRRELA